MYDFVSAVCAACVNALTSTAAVVAFVQIAVHVTHLHTNTNANYIFELIDRVDTH